MPIIRYNYLRGLKRHFRNIRLRWSKIDLNQFINLTRRKDMRKISLKELFYLKSL